MTPRASVLLPVRDGARHLEEAVRSILSDSIHLELIAVDDGSTDDSGAQLDRLAAADRRIRVLHTPARGIVAALNLALAEARAAVIVRMDADDRALPDRVRRQVDYLDQNPAVGLVGTGVALHPDGLSGLGMQRYIAWLNGIDPGDITRHRFIECPLGHPTFAARTALLRAAGGYRDGPFPEDYDLLLRLVDRGVALDRLPEVLHLWRDHHDRLSRRDDRYDAAAFRALKVRHLRSGPLAGADRVAIWGAGKTGRAFARALRGADVAIAAWVDVDPAKIGRELHGAPVVAAADVAHLHGHPLLAAVGAAGAREQIRAALDADGLREGADYWVVA